MTGDNIISVLKGKSTYKNSLILALDEMDETNEMD